MIENIIIGFVGSILPTTAVIVINILTNKKIHRLDVKVNGRLSELLQASEAVGELKGKATEKREEKEREEQRERKE